MLARERGQQTAWPCPQPALDAVAILGLELRWCRHHIRAAGAVHVRALDDGQRCRGRALGQGVIRGSLGAADGWRLAGHRHGGRFFLDLGTEGEAESAYHWERIA